MGADGNAMTAVDAKLFGSDNRSGQAFFGDNFNDSCRTLSDAEPVPPAFIFIKSEESHG